MKSEYYIAYQIKKSNRVNAWYASKMVETEEEARKMYAKKLTDTRVREIRLYRRDTYKPEELKNWAHPYDFHSFNIIDSYTAI